MRCPPFWFCFVILLFVSGTIASKPNFLILLADDLGFGDVRFLSANNSRQVALTTNIDALANGGSAFYQAYASEPVCTPSRCSILTGRYPIRSGMASSDPDFRTLMSPAQKTGFPQFEYTLAEALKTQGYKTALVGKWHLGTGIHGEHLPTAHGFDYYYGMPVSNVQTCGGKKIFKEDTLIAFSIGRTWNIWTAMIVIILVARIFGVTGNKLTFCAFILIGVMIFFFTYYYLGHCTLCARMACVLYEDDQVIEQPVVLQNLTLRFTHEAIRILEESSRDQQPFFLFVSYVKVHTALFTSNLFTNVSKAGAFGDNVEELDWSVGKIMDALEQNGLLENTLVIFTSDNGPYLERYHEGGNSGYINNPQGIPQYLKGGKGQNWEGGIRVPTIAYWKNKIPPKKVWHPVSLMDIYPTFLSLAGHAPVTDRIVDGENIASLLFANSDDEVKAPHEFLFHWCGAVMHAVRYGKWKLHWITPIWDEGTQHCDSVVICQCVGRRMRHHNPPLLYDIEIDPAENSPIDPSDEVYQRILPIITRARDEHMKSVVPYPNQLETLPRPWLMPCCDPTNNCQCTENNTRFEYLLKNPQLLENPSWKS